MSLPYELSLDSREPKFYAPAQPKMPDKPQPSAPQIVPEFDA